MLSIKQLCIIMPPPTSPENIGDNNLWDSVEKRIGIVLPDDYKEFISIYGTGYIGDFIRVFNPFCEYPSLNLEKQINDQLGALRQIKDDFGESESPYPLFPESNGLLPWGITDNGDVLYWLTRGSSDQWHSVVNESRGPYFEEFQDSMVTFLIKLIQGEIQSDIIPRDFLSTPCLFVP